MRKRLLIAFAMLIGIAVQAQVTEFPWTEGFENGQGGWTFVDQDGDGYNWNVYSGSDEARTGTYSLSSASYDDNDYDALTPNNYAFSPAITLPDDGEAYTFEYWIKNSLSSYPEYLSVYITTENTVASLANLTPVEAYTVPSDTYTKRSIGLNDYAGQTIYIVFRHHNSYDQYRMHIDDISIRQAGEPELTLPSSVVADLGVDATITANYAGSNSGLSYTWTSTMEAQGNATMSNVDNVLTINYTTTGTDQVTVTATNAYGTATATTTVNVRNCTAISTFPYTLGLNDGSLDCWIILDQNNNGETWEVSGSYLESEYNSTGQDDWLISPMITLPDEDGFLVDWDVYGGNYDVSVYYEVLLSPTGGSSPSDFTVTLYSQTYSTSNWANHTASLNDYAGQSVRVAFRHYVNGDDNGMRLRNIKIRQSGAPIITLGGPTSTLSGVDATFVVTLTEGQTPTYTWTSTMVNAGLATITENNDTAIINYSAGGTDTVTVVATNAVGSATATRTVTVVDCGGAEDLPWTASLGSNAGVQCWNFVNAGTSSNNWSRSGNGTSAYLSSRGNNTWAITPLIQMPASAAGTILEYNVRGYNNNSYEVWVAPDGGANVSNFTDSLFRETYTSNNYATRTIDLSAYSGQQIRIAFRHTHQGSSNNNSMRLQAISVRQTTVPVISITGTASVDAGASGSYAIVLTEGTTEGISYSWSSVMATAGLATITATDSTATIAYTVGGEDTITATATNAHGTATATYAVHVRECTDITTLPWNASLTATGVECWTFIDNDNNNYNWSRSGNGSNAYLSSRGTDDWAITPAIQIPTAGGDGAIVEWSVRGFSGCTYQVWVSPTAGSDVADFTDSLFSEAYTNSNTYATRSVSLGAYAGQTIRIAFRHTGSGSNNNTIRVRGIAVRLTDAPVVSFTAPSLVDANQPVIYTATLSEGITTGLTWAWTSTMEAAGLATMTATDSVLSITYTAAGTDTVRVTATNSFGSNTKTGIVTVRNCTVIGLDDLPYTENFDSYTSGSGNAFDPCWNRIDLYSASGNNYPYPSSSYNHGSGSGNCLYFYPGYDYQPEFAVMPQFDSLSSLYVNFWLYTYSINYVRMDVGVMTDPADATTFELVQSCNVTTSSTWQEFFVDFGSYTGTGKYIAFRGFVPSSYGYSIYLDDITVNQLNTCATTVDITAGTRTGDGFTVSWTPGFGLSDGATLTLMDQGGTTLQTITGATSPHVFTGLTAETQYQVKVDLLCNGEVTATATCNAMTTCEGGAEVEISSTTTGRNASTTYYVPIDHYYNNSYSQQIFTAHELGNQAMNITSVAFNYIHTTASTAYSGSIYLRLITDSTISSMSLPGTDDQLVYSGTFSMNTGWVTFDFDTPFAYDGTSNIIMTVVASGSYENSNNRYACHSVWSGGSRYYYSDTYTYSGTDDYSCSYRADVRFGTCGGSVTPGPGPGPQPQPETCNAPTNLHAVSATETTVTIDWTPGGSENQWQLQVDGGQPISVNSHPYVLSSLAAGTTYSVKVRAVCSSELSSDWSAAVSVATAAGEEPGPGPGPGDGIADVFAASVVLSPNPASSTVSISAEGLRSVELIDMSGRVQGEWNAANGEIKLDVGQMARGVYFVRLHADGFIATRKLIVSTK